MLAEGKKDLVSKGFIKKVMDCINPSEDLKKTKKHQNKIKRC